jgi:hypothetical protein
MTRRGSPTLHEAMVARLARTSLRDRFSIGLNPETLRWVISFENLSETEFNNVLEVPTLQRPESAQWDVGKEAGKAIRVANLTDTQAREFVSAVATRFKDQG